MNSQVIAANYIEAWNETDAERRRDLIARTWSTTASYADPLAQVEGHAGINTLIEGVQARFPNHRFKLSGTPDGFGDRLRFSWELGPQGGDALVKGTDFAVVGDGLILSVTGFLDQIPAGT